jgi:hypothetical protein
MCRRVECETCHKPSFAGCGRHVEDVLRDVPAEDRCRCKDAQRGDATMLDRLLRALRL